MKSTRRPRAALVLFAFAALIVAGCGSGGGTTGADHAASTGSGDTTPVATTPAGGTRTNLTRRDKAVRFAECMRAHGVGAFPDPDASGDLTLDGVANGSSLDPDGAAWKGAVRACKGLEPPGFTGSKATPTQMSARLKFAQCVRDHGVKDFPDPAKDEPLVDTNRIPSSATAAGMSNLNAAMRKCSSFAAQAGVRAGS